MVVVEARPSDPFSRETATMIILAILGSFAAIALMCWLLFTLAVFTLPAFVGVTAGVWAHQTGAGVIGAAIVGVLAAGATLGAGQLLLSFARPMWLKLLVTIAFITPAAIAGFHATHGIVKHTMPSNAWQLAFSVVGAIAIGATTFVRMTAYAPPVHPVASGAGRHLQSVRTIAPR
jgi:hypothetical protein